MKNRSRLPDHFNVEEAADHDSKLWIELARNTLLARPGNSGLFHPFISCFTTHSGKSDIDKYRRENGMLSQWRAYAVDGIAIVFDSEKLENLLEQ